MAKPLAGIRVIELANFIAGPLCGTLLADMGADVIKVEPPQGDMSRATPPIRNGESVSFTALNRNKRSLVLDLKQPAGAGGHAQARGEVRRVRRRPTGPARWRRWGSAPTHLKAVNPKIIYTSVSGFGQTGPDRRRAGVNLIIEAFSGALSVTGEPGKMPMRPGVQTADVFGALFATYATLASLVGAARTRRRPHRRRVAGRGLDRGGGLGGGGISRNRQGAAADGQPAPPDRALSVVRDQRQALRRDRHAEQHAVPANSCRCSGSTRISPIRALPPTPTARPTRTRCCRWSSRRSARWTSAELEAALMEAGVPCARVNNFKEVFEHPQIVARGVVQEVEHPRLGTMKVDAQPGAARPRRARHRAARADARRAFRGDLARARLCAGGDRGAGGGGRDQARHAARSRRVTAAE